uniref:Uncharacterized protein n=1 Tax=Arundo donax TaxID=35708 RepID=A0A0A9SG77_ARUDO
MQNLSFLIYRTKAVTEFAALTYSYPTFSPMLQR